MNDLIQRLIAAHGKLDREIRAELRRLIPDTLRVARLKKERLAIKDRLYPLFPDAGHMRSAARLVPARVRKT